MWFFGFEASQLKSKQSASTTGQSTSSSAPFEFWALGKRTGQSGLSPKGAWDVYMPRRFSGSIWLVVRLTLLAMFLHVAIPTTATSVSPPRPQRHRRSSSSCITLASRPPPAIPHSRYNYSAIKHNLGRVAIRATVAITRNHRPFPQHDFGAGHPAQHLRGLKHSFACIAAQREICATLAPSCWHSNANKLYFTEFARLRQSRGRYCQTLQFAADFTSCWGHSV